MKYSYIDNNLDFKSKILDFNNCKEEYLDVSNFKIDKKLELIDNFKKKLLEYKDLKFLIVGDYDCDGVHATTIIKILLTYLNIEHNFYIPSRIKDGYGLNEKIVTNASNNGFNVLLCLDNGVACEKEIDLANSLGLKTLIIDHHEYQKLPNANSIIHPSLLSKDYEYTCTAGLCYLLLSYFKDDNYALVLAGIATLADMVKVFKYNRYLLKETIKLINTNDFYQIKLLLNNNINISYDDLSYTYIPKLNSLSRMEPKTNINIFVEYLLSSKEVCISTINSINNINSQRQEQSKYYYEYSKRNINLDKDIIVIVLDGILEGLCGVVANKLLNDYQKPTIVLCKKETEFKGSCRSTLDINLYEYLYKIKDDFITFGGHEQALGISMDEKGLNKLYEYINSNSLNSNEISKKVIVLNENDINIDMLDIIESLKPYGTGFMEPLFVIDNLNIKKKYLIKDIYPKYMFNNQNFNAISFNSKFKDYNPKYIVGRLKKDLYKVKNVVFSIEDMG